MDQAVAISKGRQIDGEVLPEITSYLDQRHFGSLPYSGGVLEQPAWLIGGMRMVAGVVAAEQERQQKAAHRKANR